MFINLIVLYAAIGVVLSDTPANCSYNDVIGKWQYYSGPVSLKCNTVKMTKLKSITLSYPNIAVDQFGNVGEWTLIYNQGFEVKITNKKYFGYFDYKVINKTYTISYCHKLQPLWYHDSVGKEWGCFKAEKQQIKLQKSVKTDADKIKNYLLKTINYGSHKNIVDDLNNRKLSWVASDYTDFHHKKLAELLNMAGGKKSRFQRPKSAALTDENLQMSKYLPKSFDWRNINSLSYVSPVRNQKSCGSCYSFASAGMLEARFRIRSNNTIKPILSPQDVVECSPYSQGCEGGFPYLIAGKYAEDFGFAEENCNPYKGVEGKCSTKKNCKRYYATKYNYVGGFYGRCNEILMQLELVKNGPIAVSFEVYPDFMHYNGGVYHHDFKTSQKIAEKFGFNPFELTNHVVVVVGYGVTNDGVKYWTVKNSWSSTWGENGFFRIRRGNDECGIESLAVYSDPIF